jgi:hypothetical protein
LLSCASRRRPPHAKWPRGMSRMAGPGIVIGSDWYAAQRPGLLPSLAVLLPEAFIALINPVRPSVRLPARSPRKRFGLVSTGSCSGAEQPCGHEPEAWQGNASNAGSCLIPRCTATAAPTKLACEHSGPRLHPAFATARRARGISPAGRFAACQGHWPWRSLDTDSPNGLSVSGLSHSSAA